MTKSEYMEFHRKCCDKMVEITAAKNHDYTSGSDDPFSNFRTVEAINICETEIGFLTRMTDKLARINSFCQKGILKVATESVTDTLLDLANYCILMAGYLEEKRVKAAVHNGQRAVHVADFTEAQLSSIKCP